MSSRQIPTLAIHLLWLCFLIHWRPALRLMWEIVVVALYLHLLMIAIYVIAAVCSMTAGDIESGSLGCVPSGRTQ